METVQIKRDEAPAYIGKGIDGYVYWKMPDEAKKKWPDIEAKVKAALQIEPTKAKAENLK